MQPKKMIFKGDKQFPITTYDVYIRASSILNVVTSFEVHESTNDMDFVCQLTCAI